MPDSRSRSRSAVASVLTSVRATIATHLGLGLKLAMQISSVANGDIDQLAVLQHRLAANDGVDDLPLQRPAVIDRVAGAGNDVGVGHRRRCVKVDNSEIG